MLFRSEHGPERQLHQKHFLLLRKRQVNKTRRAERLDLVLMVSFDRDPRQAEASTAPRCCNATKHSSPGETTAGPVIRNTLASPTANVLHNPIILTDCSLSGQKCTPFFQEPPNKRLKLLFSCRAHHHLAMTLNGECGRHACITRCCNHLTRLF